MYVVKNLSTYWSIRIQKFSLRTLRCTEFLDLGEPNSWTPSASSIRRYPDRITRSRIERTEARAAWPTFSIWFDWCIYARTKCSNPWFWLEKSEDKRWRRPMRDTLRTRYGNVSGHQWRHHDVLWYRLFLRTQQECRELKVTMSCLLNMIACLPFISFVSVGGVPKKYVKSENACVAS